MVVLGIVNDDDLGAPEAPVPQDVLQERPKGSGIERIETVRNQASVAGAHCAEDRYALASGGVEHHGINLFWRYPHDAARTVLLEVAFILEPEFKVLSPGQMAQFFYMPPGPPGPPWQ